MFRVSVSIICLLCYSSIYSQDTIKILFSYGSKPKSKGETKWFGGIHGGHVSLSYGNDYASFVPADEVHIFPKKKHASTYIIESDGDFVFDTVCSRYLIIYIPVAAQISSRMDSILFNRLIDPGYDYALFGMRCASAAYEVLASAGLYPVYSKRKTSIKYFYPKLLRKKVLKQARLNGWKTTYRPGRKTRKWEKD